jgi:hypothetical protein
MIPHHSCLELKTITPFIHGSLFSFNSLFETQIPRIFKQQRQKVKTLEKSNPKRGPLEHHSRVEFSDPNYKLIRILYSQLWRISKTINLDHCITNQRSSIANEFVYICLYTCKVLPNGWNVRQDFSSVGWFFGFSKTTSGSKFWNFGHQRMSSSGVWKCRVMPWRQGITARELKVKLKVWGLIPYCQGITQHNDQGRCFHL